MPLYRLFLFSVSNCDSFKTYYDGLKINLPKSNAGISKIFFWNLKRGSEKGTFIDYTSHAKDYFTISGTQIVSFIYYITLFYKYTYSYLLDNFCIWTF